jgi:hypothetical protein
MTIQEFGDDCAAAKFDVAWDQFDSSAAKFSAVHENSSKTRC